MKAFAELDESEIVALAISCEEEDGRTYADSTGLRETCPETARIFVGMADEENGHRGQLIELFRSKARRIDSAGEATGRQGCRAAPRAAAVHGKCLTEETGASRNQMLPPLIRAVD